MSPGRFNPDEYEAVEDRLPKFWADHPKGRIVTDLRPSPPGEWVVFAALYREAEAEPFATGLAHEVSGAGPVNTTSALENCETSAIGRALANGGYAPKGKRPSREEMAKTQRGPAPIPSEPSADVPLCAVCSKPLSDGPALVREGKRLHKRCEEKEANSDGALPLGAKT